MGWHEVTREHANLYEDVKRMMEEYTGYRITKDKLVHTPDGNVAYEYYAIGQNDNFDQPIRALIAIVGHMAPGTMMMRMFTEVDHPFYFRCPLDILDGLPPTTNPDANAWRAAVRHYVKNEVAQ